MSIFKDSFKQGVKDQLKARQEAIIERSPQSLQYYNSRNAWIRVTSSVNVGGKSDLANKYVLQGGILSPNKNLRGGIGETNSAYSNKSPDGTNYRLGIRPMPGIKGMEVRSKSAYGSLREVTINFVAWDIRQLEELELLYMRPGYSVLVEWGWSPYLNNDKSLGTSVNYISDDILKGGISKEDIWKKTFEQASKNGNYDSLYGFIKNYSWSARPDGGYDCTTNIISTGEILESLKINYGAYETKININGLFTGGTFSRPFDKASNIKKSYSQNLIAGICNELYKILIEQITDTLTSGTYNGWNFFRFDLDVSGGETDESDFNDKPQIYIALKDFIDIMNKHVLLSDSTNNKPVVELSLTEGNHMGNPGSPLLCLGHPIQISMDPTICLIKNKGWANPKDLGLDEDLFEGNDFSTIKKIMTNLGESYWYNDDFTTTQLGITGNIYVNLSYIYSLVTSKDIEVGDRKEKNDIAVFDFLKNLMNGISTAIGNVATFDIFTDPVDGKARIIDINYTDPTPRDTVYNNAFPIEVHNLKSTVRSYKLESSIFPEQSSIIAIAAQAGGGALGEDTNTLIDFNQNLTDRIILKKESPTASTTQTDPKEEAREKSENLKNSLDIVIDFINKINPGWLESVGDYDIGDSSKYCNALKEIINLWMTFVKSDNKNRSLIPTKLSLELDGIGGIVIGNIFRIPDEVLPRGYKGDGAGPKKIAYTVTGLGHSIQNNDWKTNIDAQFLILDEPNNSNSLSTTEVFNLQILEQKIQESAELKIVAKNKSNETGGGGTPSASGKSATGGQKATSICKKAVKKFSSPPPGILPLTPWSEIKKNIGIKSQTDALAVGCGGVDTPSSEYAYFYNPPTNIALSGAKRRRKTIKYIVLHYTASDLLDPLYHYQKTWFVVNKKGYRTCADFTIGYDGKIAGFKNYKNIYTNHYGGAKWQPAGINNESIGIEIESRGYLYYCQDNGKYYDSNDREIPSQYACFVNKPYRGYSLWQKHPDQQLAALANLLLTLYHDGAIDDKTKFLEGCTGTNRYDILFPEIPIGKDPGVGIITHGTGNASGKVDTFNQPNLIELLDDLPNMIKTYQPSWNWLNTPSSAGSPPLNNTSTSNNGILVFIAGLDKPGYKSLDEQTNIIQNSVKELGFTVKGFRYNALSSDINAYLTQNPSSTVVMFSAGCEKAYDVSQVKGIDKNKIFILEHYGAGANTNNIIKNAIKNGVPARNVLVGRDVSTGKGTIDGSRSSEAKDHWGALVSIKKFIGSTPASPSSNTFSSTFSAKKVADTLFSAMNGCGTKVSLIKSQLESNVNTQKDWDDVVSAYSSRTIKCAFAKNFTGGLRASLRTELNDSDYAEVTRIITRKKIKW